LQEGKNALVLQDPNVGKKGIGNMILTRFGTRIPFAINME
jgi:hypothetical protein